MICRGMVRIWMLRYPCSHISHFHLQGVIQTWTHLRPKSMMRMKSNSSYVTLTPPFIYPNPFQLPVLPLLLLPGNVAGTCPFRQWLCDMIMVSISCIGLLPHFKLRYWFESCLNIRIHIRYHVYKIWLHSVVPNRSLGQKAAEIIC